MIKTSDFKLGNYYLITRNNLTYEGKCVNIFSPFIDVRTLIYDDSSGCNKFGTYTIHVQQINSCKDLGTFDDYCLYKGWVKNED